MKWRTAAASCPSEMCYPLCRKHGKHQAVKRRAFVTLIVAPAAWPHAAHAQQSERMRRTGVLMSRAAADVDRQVRIAAFRRAGSNSIL